MTLTSCSLSTDRRLVEGADQMIGEATFYAPPTPATSGKPGELVRTEKLDSAPEGTSAWRMIYHTLDVLGTDTVTSGVAIVPNSTPPAAGRTVVGWGHPTTGAAARCAPSNGVDPFDLIEGMDQLLDAGYAVVYPDYPGLGTPGRSSYLIGTSEGNSLLDAIRAARAIPDTHAGTEVVLWGHSQGGQAVLFAAQSAVAYAPELKVRAAAVAAPAAELGTLLGDHTDDISGVTLGSYAFAAFQSVYISRYPDMKLTDILTDAGAAATPGMAQLCLIGQEKEIHAEAGKLVGTYLHSDPATTEPWATLLRENSVGASKLGIPVFVAQGSADTLVLPAATEALITLECTAGEHMVYKEYPQLTHGSIAAGATADVVTFFSSTLAGTPPTSTC